MRMYAGSRPISYKPYLFYIDRLKRGHIRSTPALPDPINQLSPSLRPFLVRSVEALVVLPPFRHGPPALPDTGEPSISWLYGLVLLYQLALSKIEAPVPVGYYTERR